MIVDMTTGCCQCCTPGDTLPGGCCLPGAFSFDVTGNALLSTPGSYPTATFAGGRHENIPIVINPYPCAYTGPGPFPVLGYTPINYRPVVFTFRYTDPTTGLDVCYTFLWAFQYECVDEEHIRVRVLTPTNGEVSPVQDTAPAGCAFAVAGANTLRAADSEGDADLLQDLWGNIPHATGAWQTLEWNADPTPGVGHCGGTGSYDAATPMSMTLPAVATLGIPSQTFNLGFSFGTPGGPSGEYDDPTCPSYVNFATSPYVCCTDFDGDDIPGPTTGVPPGRVWTPCCPLEGKTVNKVLTVVTDTDGTCPILEFTLGITYQNALRAWVGTTISGGNFVTVVLWCTGSEWIMQIYCGGELIWGAIGGQFSGTSCPVNMTAGPNVSGSPCCAAGTALVATVYDPTEV